MPFWSSISRDSLLSEGWEKNATYLWGIPLHPLGEMNAIDYTYHAQKGLDDTRARAKGVIMQITINAVVNYIFAYNCMRAIIMVRRRPTALATWCCLIQSAAGLVYTVCSLLVTMPGGLSCRQGMWIVGAGLTISPLCVGATLLQKAYLVHERKKWLLAIGIALLLPQLLVLYYAMVSPALMVPNAGCISLYPPYLPWVKLAMDAPINTVFSIAFILVVYRQYRQYGSAAWGRLVKNGIQTMCFVVLANITCMVGAALELLGLFSEMLFLLDWIVTSTLLLRHCARMRVAYDSQITPLASAPECVSVKTDARTTYWPISSGLFQKSNNHSHRRMIR